MAKKRRNLHGRDIVTTARGGRRSALQLIGGSVAGTVGSASGMFVGARPVRAGPTDVTFVGDPKVDTDLGAFADPIGDADQTVFADTVGVAPRSVRGDGDIGRTGDPVDVDTGRNADAGDSDVTEISDLERGPQGGPQGGVGGSDPQDNDFSTIGDPIPARDKDPDDRPLADSDETRAADAADTD